VNNYPSTTIRLSEEQEKFLSSINENKTEAIRTTIDSYMKLKEYLRFEKLIIPIAIGLLLLAMGTVITNIYIFISCMVVGLIMILYGIYVFFKVKQ